MDVSLPIYIYEERTFLERFQNDQLFLLSYVDKVMATDDVFEKIKHVL